MSVFVANRIQSAAVVFSCFRIACYNYDDKGVAYTGDVYYDSNGYVCQDWAQHNYAEIAGNTCRNPEGARTKPWCFVNGHQSLCEVPLCGK